MNTEQRRREPRFEIEIGATVKVKNHDRVVRATTVSGSGCAVLLQFKEAMRLKAGESVMCHFKASDQTRDALPYWVIGHVIRVDGNRIALDFRAGIFSSMEMEADALSDESDARSWQ